MIWNVKGNLAVSKARYMVTPSISVDDNFTSTGARIVISETPCKERYSDQFYSLSLEIIAPVFMPILMEYKGGFLF